MDVGMQGWMALESAMHGERPASLHQGDARRVWRLRPAPPAGPRLFLLFSVVAAVLTVATPVLAGWVVDAIVKGEAQSTVVTLALLIALVAVLDAVVGIAERWQSSRIGEGLILDLRRAVFGHVQRMPVAFFTRTRTGALVSRLNNDVIGAQRAFTWTLSGVVSNVITLLLTLAVMLRLSWSITLLALVLLPVFVIPARRMGSQLAHLEREAADHNAAMTTQMTERFSAPGATLVKLFGRPADEMRPSSAPGPNGCATSACARPWASGCSSPPSGWSRPWPWPSSTASAAGWPCGAGSSPAPSSPWPCCSPASTPR